MTTRSKLFIVLALLLLTAACARQPSGWGESPCEIGEKQQGNIVSVSGIVEFVDDTVPGTIYADLEADGCRVGMAASESQLNTWNQVQQSAFEVDADITATGMLVSEPLPGRPDEFQWIIELRIPPEVHREGDPQAGEQHQPPGELCHVTAEVGDTVSVGGELSFVEPSAAAGIYAEIQAESGCYYKLWVERRFWDQWSAADQALFCQGESVQVAGLLTVVLGEHTIDLADPPLRLSP